MSVTDGVSRVLCNFDGSFDSVQTLAHELGHAYHNVNLGERTPMQRSTPMALAETAAAITNRNALGDVATGAFLAEAGMRAAAVQGTLPLLAVCALVLALTM